MLIHTIPNTKLLSIPGAPTILASAYEAALAAQPGLFAYLDPGTPSAERVSNTPYTHFNGQAPATAPAVGLTNKPAWTLNAATLSVYASAGARNSFTMLGVIYPTAAGVVGGMLLTGETARNILSFSGTSMSFAPISPGALNTPANSAPALNAASVIGISLDYGSRQSSILMPNGTWSVPYTHSSVIDVQSDAGAKVGFYRQGNNVMQGYYGDQVWLDRPLHLGAHAVQSAALIALLKGKYGIA